MSPGVINTPLQRGELRRDPAKNRFNGFGREWETVKTVTHSPACRVTPLKRGVNESGTVNCAVKMPLLWPFD